MPLQLYSIDASDCLPGRWRYTPSHSTIQPQKETYKHPTPASTQILVLLVQEAESVAKLERWVSPREGQKRARAI